MAAIHFYKFNNKNIAINNNIFHNNFIYPQNIEFTYTSLTIIIQNVQWGPSELKSWSKRELSVFKMFLFAQNTHEA